MVRSITQENFSNTLLQKVLTLVPLTATVPEVFFTTMTTFIYNYYDVLDENLNDMKSIKIIIYPEENVTYCCAEILVDAERLESTGAFNPENLG